MKKKYYWKQEDGTLVPVHELTRLHVCNIVMKFGKDKLRELAVVLTETIRNNASIDWEIKENVRAKMRVAIKRLLRRYGYPPDMQLLATETVIKQAEMISAELISANKE